MIDSTSSGIREFKCKAGYYGNQEGMSDEKCSGPCDSGTFCLLGSTVATPCPTGHYNPAPAAISCQGCPKGFYADETGQSTCQRCKAGTYAISVGTPLCNKCGPGTYANDIGREEACGECSCPSIVDCRIYFIHFFFLSFSFFFITLVFFFFFVRQFFEKILKNKIFALTLTHSPFLSTSTTFFF